MWQRWETALITSDTRALSQLVSPGPMLSAVIDECAVSSTRCVYETAPRPIRGLNPIVPLQRRYPIHFLVEIKTTDSVHESNGLVGEEPWVELQILTKASAQASWKLSFDTGYDGVNGGQPSFLPFAETPAGPTLPGGGQDLYNLPPQRPPPVPTSRFLPLLAAYYQSYKDTGHAPPRSLILPDGSSDGAGQRLALARQDSVYLGSRSHYQLTADPGAGEWEFAVTGSAQMVCGSIRDTDTTTALPGGLMYQNPQEANYGVPLPTGNYLQLVRLTEHETCIYVVKGGLDAVGDNTFGFQLTGKLANNDLVALETNYGVLAEQLSQYGTTLIACERVHPLAHSCVKPFAQNAEQQFAHFYDVVTGTEPFPARFSGEAARMAATARQLTLLSGQLATAQTMETIKKIETGEKTLSRQYKTLVTDLS